MTLTTVLRPVLVALAFAGVSACGAVEDPHRLETLGRQIADVPLDGQADAVPAAIRQPSSPDDGLRPALKVDVMNVHDFWDARDGIASATDAVEPVVTRAFVQQTGNGPETVMARPALHNQDVPVQTVLRPSSGLVQLGAYASEDAARAAWARLKSGSAAWALEGLTPVYETVQVQGRRLVRLKVQTPPAGAPAVCAAAGIDDPWCHRAT